MYGLKDQSMPQRLFILVLQLLFLAFVFWFLFLNGNQAFHLPVGNEKRKILLFLFCLIVFFRMNFMIFFLLKRGITWTEAFNIPFAFLMYYIGYSMLGGIKDTPINGLDYFGIFLFLAGSTINTLSELLRNAWKKDERNKGKLYTGGLFKYAIHINYFGDVVWVTGFALITSNLWSSIFPIILISMFVFYNIPEHDKYLREKYKGDFVQYEKNTKKLIPFFY